jgi:hypothetical protein
MYDPKGESNSALFSLSKGTLTFVPGEALEWLESALSKVVYHRAATVSQGLPKIQVLVRAQPPPVNMACILVYGAGENGRKLL